MNRPFPEAVEARRVLSLRECPAAVAKGFKTLADAGWDGDYVTPNQITSHSPTGPVLMLDNWIGWKTADCWSDEKKSTVRTLGYDPNLQTNKRTDGALSILSERWGRKIDRGNIYITQASLFLAPDDRGAHPKECYRVSFEKVVSLEIAGRKIVAAGAESRKMLLGMGFVSGEHFVHCRHPAFEAKAKLADALEWAMNQ